MTTRGTNLATLGVHTLYVHCAPLLAKGPCTLVCLAHSTGLIHRNPGSGTRRFYVAEKRKHDDGRSPHFATDVEVTLRQFEVQHQLVSVDVPFG